MLKTECIYRAKLNAYKEARLLIDEYIYFYNNQRIQLIITTTEVVVCTSPRRANYRLHP